MLVFILPEVYVYKQNSSINVHALRN